MRGYRVSGCLITMMSVVFISSCASFPPVYQDVRTRFVQDEVPQSSGGQIYVRSVSWNREVLMAHAEQDRLCFKTRRTGTISQTWAVQKVRGLTAPFTIGGIFAGGGATAVGLGANYGTNKIAIVAGAAAIAFGVSELIYASVRASVAKEWKVGGEVEHFVLGASSPGNVCGLDGNPNGRVDVLMGTELLASRNQQGSEISFDIEPLKNTVCRREDLLGKPLVINFASLGQQVVLGLKDMDGCIRKTVSSDLVRQAIAQFARSKEPSSLIQVVSHVGHADSVLEGLPESDPERKETAGLIANLRTAAREHLVGSLNKLLQDFRTMSSSDAATVGQQGMRILEYGRGLPDLHYSAWEEVFKKWTEVAIAKPAASAESLKALLEADVDTRSCLFGLRCPQWLTKSSVIGMFTPYIDGLLREFQDATEGLRVATASLLQNVTLRNADAIKRGMQLALQTHEKGCVLESMSESLWRECDRLDAARIDGKQALDTNQDKLFELEMLSTQAAWKEYIGRCKFVFDTWRSVQTASPCGAACQVEKRKVIAERQKLYLVPAGPLSNTMKRELLEQCHLAQCPRCP